MTQNLRQVHALILQATPATANLRQAHALVLSASAASLGIPAGKKASETLVAAILATASTVGKNVKATDFTLGEPVAITGTKNTSVKITTANIDAVLGSQTLRYDRKGLSNAAFLFGTPIETDATATSVLSLLTKINTLAGLVFEARDFEDTQIAAGATSVTLVAGVGSYIFIPGTTVTIPLHPNYPSLATAIANSHLNGFTPAS